MTEETFDPEDHMWSFTGYFHYEFQFCTADKPYRHMGVGGFSNDIYNYHIWAGKMTYSQVTDDGSIPILWADW